MIQPIQFFVELFPKSYWLWDHHFPLWGKPKFQIQRDKDSEIGKGLRSAGQACGYSEPTHGLPAETLNENSNSLGSDAQIIPQLQIWKSANSYVTFPTK